MYEGLGVEGLISSEHAPFSERVKIAAAVSSTPRRENTADLVNVALKLFRTLEMAGGGNGAGGGMNAVRNFISATEKVIGFLDRKDDSEFDDRGARADIQAAFRTSIDIGRRVSAGCKVEEIDDANQGEDDGTLKRKPTLRLLGSRKPKGQFRGPGSFSTEDKSAINSCARRIGTYLQVAIYKASPEGAENREDRVSSSPSVTPPVKGNEKLRRKLSFAGTVSDRIPRTNSTFLGSSPIINIAIPSAESAEWIINPIFQPLIPLRERKLRQYEHGTTLPCMWNGHRVIAKAIRGDWEKFEMEANFLWSLAPSSNVQKMLGGYYESSHNSSASERKPSSQGQKGSEKGSTDTEETANKSGIGFIILEHANGISLNKAVRGNRLNDRASQVRVFAKITSALSFVAGLEPSSTHQNLHPGNVLLVPKAKEDIDSMDVTSSTVSKSSSTSSRKVESENSAARELNRAEEGDNSWTTRADGTLRISNHVVKVLDFGQAVDARSGSRAAHQKDKTFSGVRREMMVGYIAPEKRTGNIEGAFSTADDEGGKVMGNHRKSWKGRKSVDREKAAEAEKNAETKKIEYNAAAVRRKSLADAQGIAKNSGGGAENDKGMSPKKISSTGTDPVGLATSVSPDSLAKVDIWSMGWIMYYMVTGKHPDLDVTFDRMKAATCEVDGKEQSILDEKMEKELAHAQPAIRSIVEMCAVYNPEKRATLRELKEALLSLFEAMVFVKGVSLVESSHSHGMAMMDRAVGIKAPKSDLYRDVRDRKEKRHINGVGLKCFRQEGHTDEGDALMNCQIMSKKASSEAIGTKDLTYKGLHSLPLVIVRRVEWEAMAKAQLMSECEVAVVKRALVSHMWSKSDVKDGPAAIKYLVRRDEETGGGNGAAKSALGWIYRWGAGGADKNMELAVKLWQEAMFLGDAEAVNGLVLLYHHGRPNIVADGRAARGFYDKAIEWGYAAAAVNVGVMLHDGAAGVVMDGIGARKYYERANDVGDGVAANNLGLLYQFGAPGVEVDGSIALRHYEVSIVRGERNHGRRNLGELLWEGAPGVERDCEAAVQNLVVAATEGDAIAIRLAKKKLKKVVESEDLGEVREKTLSLARQVVNS